MKKQKVFQKKQTGKTKSSSSRRVMFRPDRLKYVKKEIKSSGCIFCNAKTNGVSFESLCVYQDQDVIVMLNKYPYNSGHVMVVPARHVGHLGDLSEQEHLAVQRILQRTVKIAQEAFEPGGINVGLNMGAAAGAGLPDHLHWHLIPRWAGDTNFFPLIAETKVVPESLEQIYERYKKYFN